MGKKGKGKATAGPGRGPENTTDDTQIFTTQNTAGSPPQQSTGSNAPQASDEVPLTHMEQETADAMQDQKAMDEPTPKTKSTKSGNESRGAKSQQGTATADESQVSKSPPDADAGWQKVAHKRPKKKAKYRISQHQSNLQLSKLLASESSETHAPEPAAPHPPSSRPQRALPTPEQQLDDLRRFFSSREPNGGKSKDAPALEGQRLIKKQAAALEKQAAALEKQGAVLEQQSAELKSVKAKLDRLEATTIPCKEFEAQWMAGSARISALKNSRDVARDAADRQEINEDIEEQQAKMDKYLRALELLDPDGKAQINIDDFLQDLEARQAADQPSVSDSSAGSTQPPIQQSMQPSTGTYSGATASNLPPPPTSGRPSWRGLGGSLPPLIRGDMVGGRGQRPTQLSTGTQSGATASNLQQSTTPGRPRGLGGSIPPPIRGGIGRRGGCPWPPRGRGGPSDRGGRGGRGGS